MPVLAVLAVFWHWGHLQEVKSPGYNILRDLQRYLPPCIPTIFTSGNLGGSTLSFLENALYQLFALIRIKFQKFLFFFLNESI